MINDNEVFLNAVTLAAYSGSSDNIHLLKIVLEAYDQEVQNGAIIDDDGIIAIYIKIIRDVVDGSLDLTNQAEITEYLIWLKSNCKHQDTVDGIAAIFANREHATPRRISTLVKKLQTWAIWTKSNRALKKMYSASQQHSATMDKVKQDILFTEFLNHARDITQACENGVNFNNANVDFIDMSCKSSISKGLDSYTKKRKITGFRSGLQALNRSFGESGGVAPGEFVAFAALSHNYKSGILVDWARWISTLNVAKAPDNRIPVIVFISLENEIYENQMSMFRAAYRNAFKEDPGSLSNDEVIDYVASTYGCKGFSLRLFRELGDIFTYDTYVSKLETLKSQGCHIVATIIDYITLMNWSNEVGGNDAKKIQNLCNRVANYGRHNGMATITGLQLDNEAEVLAHMGVQHVVKKFSAKNLADSKGIMREVDVLYFMHIETNHLGVPYLTLNKGKHRDVEYVSKEDKFMAFRFTPLGILDDISGQDSSTKNIYDDQNYTPDTSAEYTTNSAF